MMGDYREEDTPQKLEFSDRVSRWKHAPDKEQRAAESARDLDARQLAKRLGRSRPCHCRENEALLHRAGVIVDELLGQISALKRDVEKLRAYERTVRKALTGVGE